MRSPPSRRRSYRGHKRPFLLNTEQFRDPSPDVAAGLFQLRHTLHLPS